jgi:PAS domain-containing protein
MRAALGIKSDRGVTWLPLTTKGAIHPCAMGEIRQSKRLDTQLYSDVFNASPIGIVVENLDGQPLFVNPAFCSMLGFNQDELRSKHCVDFSPLDAGSGKGCSRKCSEYEDFSLLTSFDEFQPMRSRSIRYRNNQSASIRRDYLDTVEVWGSSR